MKSRVRGIAVLIMAGVIVAVRPGLLAQHPYEWPVYGRDAAGTKYSPLKQINLRQYAESRTTSENGCDAAREGGQRFRFADAPPCDVHAFRGSEWIPMQRSARGELSAVNASTGDVVWRVPLGNYPELEAKGFKDFGAPNLGGSIVTAGGLVFIAATNDHMFRAFDSKTGKLLWTAELEATGNATPSTYMGNNGKQYVVINGASPGNMSAFAGGDKVSDTIVAFSLP